MTATTDVDIDSLAAEIYQEDGRCKLGRFLDEFPGDVEKLSRYTTSPTYPQNAKLKLLHKLGLAIGEKTLRRHLNGECACD